MSRDDGLIQRLGAKLEYLGSLSMQHPTKRPEARAVVRVVADWLEERHHDPEYAGNFTPFARAIRYLRAELERDNESGH